MIIKTGSLVSRVILLVASA